MKRHLSAILLRATVARLPAAGDWVLVLNDAARKPLEPGNKLHKP